MTKGFPPKTKDRVNIMESDLSEILGKPILLFWAYGYSIFNAVTLYNSIYLFYLIQLYNI